MAAAFMLAALAFLAPAGARASIAYGSINNFDTVNDTGHECHGFEIEVEDCRSTDVTYTYNYNHYGVPRITQDDTIPAHPRCIIRWESKKNLDGTWAAFTAIPTGPISPTNGHMFTNPNVNFGGEHFGVGFRAAVGAIRYNWLIDNGAGALVHGGAVQVSTPSFTYFPAAGGALPQVQAVIAPPPPPAPEPKEFGKAVWVKEIRTTTHNNNEVRLRDLVSDDPGDANDKNWRNGEPDEVETEWQILQKDYNKADGGANNEVPAAPEDLPGGDEVVTRRYEFFKYVGPLDNETGEAMCQSVAADGIHGVGVKIINGVSVDLATVVVVGDYTGAQMAAVDVDAPVGLIDHVGEGEVNTPYAARTVVIEGSMPFTCVRDGALPAGMTFDEVTGVLEGTPTVSGEFQFTITASDGWNPDVEKKYTLVIAADGAVLPPRCLIDTTVSPVGSGTTTGDGSFAPGANVTVTAAPAAGYHFVNWTDDGQIVGASASYTLVANVNHSLVANFAANPAQCAITTSANPAASGGTSGGGTVAVGSSVTVVATANAGFTFVNWTEGGAVVSASASYTFNAAGDRVLVANFRASGGGGGLLVNIGTATLPVDGGTVSGGGVYASGSSVTLRAVNNAGFKFSKWTEGGATVSTAKNFTLTATASRALTAVFLPALSVGVFASPPEGGAVAADSPEYEDGDGADVQADANPGYTFQNWTEGGVVVSTDRKYQFTITASRTLTANFTSQGSVTIGVSATPAIGGAATGGRSAVIGSQVTVLARPAAGYKFTHWSEGGMVVSEDEDYEFTAGANRALVANFIAVPAMELKEAQEPDELDVEWPEASDGWVLEESCDLVTWTASTVPVSTGGGRKRAKVSTLPGSPCFFRLSKVMVAP